MDTARLAIRIVRLALVKATSVWNARKIIRSVLTELARGSINWVSTLP
jgi:hypothetical protein